MVQHKGLLTPEEQARITELHEHREATAQANEGRVRELEVEIDHLFREKRESEKWATVGSA